MQIRVVTETGEPVDEFLVRLGGWTEERYLREAPEDRIWEFADGEVVVHSPASITHQRIVRFLTYLLTGYVEERSLGEVFNGPAALRLRPGLITEPDLFFVAAGRAAVGPLLVEGSADLVVEVASPATRTYDLQEKAAAYREGGVGEYWVVDPGRKEVTVHRLERTSYRTEALAAGRLVSSAVPGFWIEVAWLWQDPLPQATACLREILSSGSG
ncbi:MAG: Uma2 family endonuclease [Armatimonadota bacterium]|nr:Uma2 family endonuclease [Armatimonadota bacterium]MDR7563456.1 Uma2 family endonuclease [Armatimonadota bacterium]MDR7567501.1 Uma2 family endonuclease [Armatimonadota bacterium]